MARENGTQEALLDRRSYLKMAGTAAATVATTTAATSTATADSVTQGDENSLTGVHGAIYWPARAYNHYQVWDEYNPDEIDRDFGYAADLGLNSLRVITGWEYWNDHPEQFRRRFDNFVELAREHGLQLLPCFFEPIGDFPTRENFNDNDVLTSFAVKSPGPTVVRNEDNWDGPRRFVEWFAGRYGDHDGVIALEIMNEPAAYEPRVEFCQEMLRAARDANPNVPLTMGCKDFHFNQLYEDPGLDIHQFHINLPETAEHMREELRKAEEFSDETGKPIWLTEWQRARKPEPPNRMLPNYSSIADVVYESDIDGDHFWQLMLKPAYIDKPRKMGRLNGLFHEDGTVYSEADAQAIAGGADRWTEREEWPEWTEPAEEKWGPTEPVYQA